MKKFGCLSGDSIRYREGAAAQLLGRVLTVFISAEQQIYRVKYLPEPPPGDLDLNCSDEEFSPDKLRSNLERFYVTVVRLLNHNNIQEGTSLNHLSAR